MSAPPKDPVQLRRWARALLLEANEDAPLEMIERYLDAYANYREAQANIDEHGALSAHPRTGAPMKNPYLEIRAAATKEMDRCELETDDLWDSDEPEPTP